MNDSVLWASIPLPAVLIDGKNTISNANPAAELFLNSSYKSLVGAPVWDRIFIDAPLESSLSRVRNGQAPIFVNNVEVGSGDRAPRACNIRIAPMSDDSGYVLLVMDPRELADRLGRAMSPKSAAQSAIGMEEMLAHEIKNLSLIHI